jgi:hypothetical protein
MYDIFVKGKLKDRSGNYETALSVKEKYLRSGIAENTIKIKEIVK